MPRLIVPESEREFFDALAIEHLDLAVETVNFWSNLSSTSRDPLYQEPTDHWDFEKFEVTAYVRKPEPTPTPFEAGQILEKAGLFVVARKALEDASAPVPKIGDVIDFWGLWYDITKVVPKGFVSDAEFWTHYECVLQRRTRYIPELKPEPAAPPSGS